MKIVVIGGSGLIGKKLIPKLLAAGHEAISASPSTGVNTVTGEGLTNVLKGVDVVVDVSNSPSFETNDVMQFFTKSTRNLMSAEADAGVKHHVALSVVGADRLADSGYMQAKIAQEKLIRESSIPFTLLRATQFFEFLEAIAWGGTVDDTVRQPTAPMQPVAAEDVAATLAEIVVSQPVNAIIELAGPESLSIADFVARYLARIGDPRSVIADPSASYFGAKLDNLGLNPGDGARLGRISFDEWAGRNS